MYVNFLLCFMRLKHCHMRFANGIHILVISNSVLTWLTLDHITTEPMRAPQNVRTVL